MNRENFTKENMSYAEEQLDEIEKHHDWSYCINMKITASNGRATKALNVTKEQFKKIMEAMR